MSIGLVHHSGFNWVSQVFAHTKYTNSHFNMPDSCPKSNYKYSADLNDIPLRP